MISEYFSYRCSAFYYSSLPPQCVIILQVRVLVLATAGMKIGYTIHLCLCTAKDFNCTITPCVCTKNPDAFGAQDLLCLLNESTIFIPSVVIIQNCHVKINAYKSACTFLYQCANTSLRFILSCVILSVATSASQLHKVPIMDSALLRVFSIEFFTTQ